MGYHVVNKFYGFTRSFHGRMTPLIPTWLGSRSHSPHIHTYILCTLHTLYTHTHIPDHIAVLRAVLSRPYENPTSSKRSSTTVPMDAVHNHNLLIITTVICFSPTMYVPHIITYMTSACLTRGPGLNLDFVAETLSSWKVKNERKKEKKKRTSRRNRVISTNCWDTETFIPSSIR